MKRGDCRYWPEADRFPARTNVRIFESLSYDIRSAVTIVPAQRTIGGISIGLHPSPRERGMSKSVIRLLTLAIYATAPVVVPVVTPAKGATSSSGEIEKKKNQKSPGVSDPRSSSPSWPPPMNDDPDRKASGGGGM